MFDRTCCVYVLSMLWPAQRRSSPEGGEHERGPTQAAGALPRDSASVSRYIILSFGGTSAIVWIPLSLSTASRHSASQVISSARSVIQGVDLRVALQSTMY
ncbi:hypothetical protein BDW02DRAFT_182231 [Decorospora gaudefroyi]|uniref:Uncharacterized protein n=1 Tax=Decorospora gaudefroyi TaxID=184978 RepID=A0A6A5KN36_9PLEO|nr:hypothetical protein BDW02DRAFT_182231 [Decorospora gaudefroyi]